MIPVVSHLATQIRSSRLIDLWLYIQMMSAVVGHNNRNKVSSRLLDSGTKLVGADLFEYKSLQFRVDVSGGEDRSTMVSIGLKGDYLPKDEISELVGLLFEREVLEISPFAV
jgi:hypothetical protein